MLIISSPVRGAYVTPNTPGSRVPSHGTAAFGEEYAIDFVMVPPSGDSKKPYAKSPLSYLARGAALRDFYGYGQNVYAPIAGEVIAVENCVAERDPATVFGDVAYARRATKDFVEGKAPTAAITGNCAVIRGEGGVYALLAHLKTGSVAVRVGQRVAQGDVVGLLGHSGNSTMPHLHMQFMDSADYRVAKGIPFAFREYEVKTGNGWTRVSDSLPKDSEIVRFR